MCLDADIIPSANDTMDDRCQRCNGIGFFQCEATKICGGCKIMLRVGCFNANDPLCRTFTQRKKYVKRTVPNHTVQEVGLPVSETDIDIDEFVTRNTEILNELVDEAVVKDKAVKIYLTLDTQLARKSETGTQYNTGRFQTPVQMIGGGLHDLDIEMFRRNLHDLLDRFTNLGSGFTLIRILKFVLHIAKYRTM